MCEVERQASGPEMCNICFYCYFLNDNVTKMYLVECWKDKESHLKITHTNSKSNKNDKHVLEAQINIIDGEQRVKLFTQTTKVSSYHGPLNHLNQIFTLINSDMTNDSNNISCLFLYNLV